MTSVGDVKELSTCKLTLSFTDESGDAVTPSSATYRIDDESSGTNIVGVTSFTPGDLVVAAASNYIVVESNSFEVRRVTIEWVYDTDKVGHAEVFYRVLNLKYVSTTTTTTTTTPAP